jgi:hypothetical protein
MYFEKRNILIMQEILKVNRSLADTHSLYIAASSGFVRAVEILLNIGVKDTCLKCNGTFYWKDNIKENEIDETHTGDKLSDNYTNFKNMLSASFRYVGFPFVQYLENVCLIVLDSQKYGCHSSIVPTT